MSKVLVTEEYLEDIADAIREKTGGDATYTPAQMGDAIRNIPSGGNFNPSAYKGFLQSDGNSWIETDYIVKDDTHFELVATVESANASYAVIFGTRDDVYDQPSSHDCVLFGVHNSQGYYKANWGSVTAQIADMNNYFYDKKCMFKFKKGNASVDNGDVSAAAPFESSASASSTSPLYIYSLDEAGREYGSATRCKMKLYNLKVYEGDNLVKNYIPFSDNGTPCLKDDISGDLLYNAGSGNLVYEDTVDMDLSYYTAQQSGSYTIDKAGLYMIVCAVSHGSTHTVTIPQSATVIDTHTVDLANGRCVEVHIVELSVGDVVSIEQTWQSWVGRAFDIIHLDGIESLVNLDFDATSDGSTSNSVSAGSKKLVLGLGIGASYRNDTVLSNPTYTLSGLWGNYAIVALYVTENAETFSFYGYDGGLSCIGIWEIS